MFNFLYMLNNADVKQESKELDLLDAPTKVTGNLPEKKPADPFKSMMSAWRSTLIA